ncbi:hypothetical protein HDU85_005361 [Gaertneriomyces sp. JEL0708]|nr:hypothetical protein HDU85_005361 [Gaertneriomyces sp. JEL0708]
MRIRSASAILAVLAGVAAQNPAEEGAFKIISENSGVVAVHLALLPGDKVFLSERFHEIPNDYLQVLPNGQPNSHWNGNEAEYAWFAASDFYKPNKNLGDFLTDSAQFDLTTNTFKMLEYAYSVDEGYGFCNGAAQMADGGIMIAGGDQKWDMVFKGKNITSDGRRDVRIYKDEAIRKVATMAIPNPANKEFTGRWYPTLITLPNEDVMILGGHHIYFAPTEPRANDPSYEIFKAATSTLEPPVPVEVLVPTFPINMYPISYVLPHTGEVFTLAGNMSSYLNYETKTEKPGPSLPEDNVYPRSFPFAGTNWLNPLSKANNYNPTVWATPRCYHLDPETDGATWVPEDMPLARSQPMAINLPDGHTAIFGGSGQGHQGGDAGVGYMANMPVNKVVLFNPSKTGVRRWKIGAEAQVARLYHATSVLRTDGSVLLAGSDEQNFDDKFTDPYELRLEAYYPPYFAIPNRPALDLAQIPATATFGQKIIVPLTSDIGSTIRNVSFIRYGTSTHTMNVDQRHVELEILQWGKNKLLVQMPPDAKIAPPGNWMLFAVDKRGAPVVQAATVNLRASNVGTDATWDDKDTITPDPFPADDDKKEENSAFGTAKSTFANDGSFVERFRQMQTEQDEKRKRQDAIEKKKQWEASFRQRGKRKKQADAEDSKNKAAKTQADLDATASAYLREMRKMKEQLPDGDSGSGVRPLVK